MRNLKEEMQKEYKNVDISDEKSDVIFNNILNIHNKKKKTKVVLFNTSLVLIIMIFGFGIIYADEIKENINIFISKVTHKNDANNNYTLRLESIVRKELTFDAKLDEPKCVDKMDRIYGIRNSKCYSTYSSNQLNDLLGVRLLNSNNSKLKDYTLYKVLRDENNNIKHLDFRIANIFQIMPENGNKYQNQEGLLVSLRAMILTKYYTNDNIYWDYSVDKDAHIEEYYINSLKTKAYITDYKEDKADLLDKERKIVLFTYDSIVYRLDITSLYSKNDTIKNIYSLLESLTY